LANDKQTTGTATLISYDKPQFDWAKEMLISGSIENVQNGNGVLVGYGYS
jgi:putative ABC transport system permease protein